MNGWQWDWPDPVFLPPSPTPVRPICPIHWNSKWSLQTCVGVQQRTEDGRWTLNGVTRAFPQTDKCSSCSKRQIISEEGVLIWMCPFVFTLFHLWPICCWDFACIQSSFFIFFALHGNRAQMKKYIITRYNIVFPPYIKACTFWSSKIAQITLFSWQWHELFDQSKKKYANKETVH